MVVLSFFGVRRTGYTFLSVTVRGTTTILFPFCPLQNTGYVNYDEMEHIADFYRPKLIVCGGSAYARDWDFARMRKVNSFYCQGKGRVEARARVHRIFEV